MKKKMKRTTKRATKRKAKPMAVSDQLRAIIAERELTSYRLGKMTGLEPSAISRFVNGQQLRTDTFGRICLAMNLELRPRGE